MCRKNASSGWWIIPAVFVGLLLWAVILRGAEVM